MSTDSFGPGWNLFANASLARCHPRSGIDSERSKYTVLSPLPGKLPRTRLLVGSVEWQDL